jgi:hypothetical protein
MRKLFYLQGFICFTTCMLLLISSCNNGNDDGKTDTPSSSNTTTEVAKPPAPALVGGTLDTLWMPVGSFPANGARVVFSIIIDANDKLTLNGWRDNGGPNQFNTPPDYILTNTGQHNGSMYGPNMYFGNVVLRQQDVAAINQLINAAPPGTYTKVLFVPKMVNTNHIGYDIFLGNNNDEVSIMTVVPTGEEANPSPPRDY